jgi:hypothetical protein
MQLDASRTDEGPQGDTHVPPHNTSGEAHAGVVNLKALLTASLLTFAAIKCARK